MQEAAERTCDGFPVQVGGCGGRIKGLGVGKVLVVDAVWLLGCSLGAVRWIFLWRESSMC